MKLRNTRHHIVFNRVLMHLTTSDVFTWGLLVIVNALVGIYLSTKFGVSAIQIIGIGTGIYSLTRGAFQIPIGVLIDKIKKDSDDIMILFLGNVLMGLPFLFYPSINSEYFFYMLQFVLGAGAAMNLVSWRKMFAKNLKRNDEGREYGIYETVMSVSSAGFSFLAGYIANINQDYFDAVMVTIGIIMILSGFIVLSIFRITDRQL